MREQIQGLADDVQRLLMTGGKLAAEDQSLRRRAKALRELAGQVPALTPLAAAVEHVIQATPKEATPALIQVLLLVRQVRSSLAVAGADGTGAVEPAQRGGPWFSTLEAVDLLLLYEARRKAEDSPAQRQARRSALREALTRYLGRPGQNDLRLLQPFLERLDDDDVKLAEQGLPAYGRGLIGELRQSLDFQGGARDAHAFAILCRLDPKTARSLCQKALSEGNWLFQAQALRSLAEIDPAEAERTALKMLQGKAVPQVRGAALVCLARSKADPALDQLLAGLTESGKVFEGAAEGLRKSVHPRTGHRLLDVLKAAVAEVESLTPAKGGKKKASQPSLTKPDQARRIKAEQMIMRTGDLLTARGDLKGIETILELLKHKDPDVSEAAAQSFIEIGPNARAAVPLLIQALEDNDEDVRAVVAEALGAIGPAAPESLPALVKLLEDKRWWVQTTALEALELFNEMAVGPLSEGLQSDNAEVRATSASALGNLGAHAVPVVRDLVAVLRDRSGEVRRQAVFALGQVGEAAGAQVASMVVPALADLTTDKDKDVQAGAFRSLRDFGSEARSAVPSLIKSLKDPSPQMRQLALESLEAIGPAAHAAVPEVTKLLKDRSVNVREAAKRTLAEIQ
jgi:HEAT repeat protein